MNYNKNIKLYNKQNVGDKVYVQKGNSPEYKLKFKIIIKCM